MYLPIGRFRLKSYATPILVLFKENKPIDIHMGVFYAKDKIGLTFNQKIVNNILARNGLIPQTNVNLIWKDTKRKHIEKEKRMSRRSISFSDIPNTILRNKAMDFMIISSVNFENSDFSNASLKRTIFAHVNLKGAHMGSADLTGSIWIDTICPNGKNSRQTGDTCVHQNPHNHK